MTCTHVNKQAFCNQKINHNGRSFTSHVVKRFPELQLQTSKDMLNVVHPLLRKLVWPGRRWKPLVFPTTKGDRLPLDQKIEEELLPDYRAARYYPVRIGDILKQRYQVVGKLGFGATSTVWLARDLIECRHVTLKLYITSKSLGDRLDHEEKIYKRISECKARHQGRHAIRTITESFDVGGPDGSHRCLVHPPLFESVLTFLRRNPVERLPAIVLAVVLRHLFIGLDFLHKHCHVIHTDIKADNIMFSINDDSVYTDFEEQELTNPSPCKVVDGRPIYVSRQLRMPKAMGAPVLCDFGSAVLGDEMHTEDVQPNVYRSPEVILEVPWSYEIDIWNAGCMVFDLFEGGHLFTGRDPELQTYRSRAHLAEMVALLGLPPQAMLETGKASQRFFNEHGNFSGGIPLPESASIEQIVGHNVKDRPAYIAMLNKALQWDPAERATAKELAEDPWILKAQSTL